MSFGQAGPHGSQQEGRHGGPGETQPVTPPPWGQQPQQQAPPQVPPPPAASHLGPGGAPMPPGAQLPGWQQPAAPADTPDWSALAESGAARDRRRKLLMIGGGVLATAAVAGIVAAAVALSGKDDKDLPPAQKLPSASAGTSEPTFSQNTPPPNPLEFISSADKDTAPLNTKTIFPHTKPSIDKRQYERVATHTALTCSDATQGGLGHVLARNDCRQVLRATYVRDGVAVTVGVAVFDTKAKADQAKADFTGNITPLTGGEAPSFCKGTACRLTANSQGRYAYFTVAGYTDGSAVPDNDTKALQAGRDLSGYIFRRIMDRANAAAAGQPQPSGKPSDKPAQIPSGKPSSS
ncbi:hypothetical protein [Streptomyces sp. NPDC049555]|uniref:hypothetical protein n=1 Tax=Streptomyces sp. NPDC049555 TaxID=3154930 RepID=UPI003439AB4D